MIHSKAQVVKCNDDNVFMVVYFCVWSRGFSSTNTSDKFCMMEISENKIAFQITGNQRPPYKLFMGNTKDMMKMMWP